MITITLNGTVIGGCGSDFVLAEDNLSGLGMPDVKPMDIDLQLNHGSVASRDFLATRVIGIPIIIYRKLDPAAAMVAARQLKAAWQPARDGNDDILTVEAAGLGPLNDVMTFFGRPRGGLELDLVKHYAGLITAYGSFTCLDPLGYGDEQTSGGTSFSINNIGTAATDRISLVITGNDGTPAISNNRDPGRVIRFGEPLTSGRTRHIDVRAKTVVTSSGDDRYDNLAPTNQWFDILPGVNNLAVTGASSISITWRPAWY